MFDFVLIFRSRPRALTPDELARRQAAAIAWAQPLREHGTLVQSILVADDGVAIAADGTSTEVGAGAIAAITVIRASDLEAATALARRHPGLAFGTSVEVRPVKPLPTLPVRG